jgi:hypothetical protein
MSKKSVKTPSAPAAPVKTREQLMDERAAADFAAMDKVNNDRSIEHRIMNAPDMNPLAPKPSGRNRASQGVDLFDMTFSQYGETRSGNSAFMRSRRRFGGW